MGKPYSQDLRERVIAAVDTGTGAYVAALLFQVSVSYIYKALIRRRKTGEVTARRSGCGPKPKLAPHDDALRARVAAEPDITLAELQAWLLAERKVNVSIRCRPASILDEREAISERTKAALVAAKVRGKRLGTPESSRRSGAHAHGPQGAGGPICCQCNR